MLVEAPSCHLRDGCVVKPDEGDFARVVAPVGVDNRLARLEERCRRAVVHHADDEAVEPPQRLGVSQGRWFHRLQPPLRARQGVVADTLQQRASVRPVGFDLDRYPQWPFHLRNHSTL